MPPPNFEAKFAFSPNDPSFFETVFSPNAPAFGSVSLTPISIWYWSAPPDLTQHASLSCLIKVFSVFWKTIISSINPIIVSNQYLFLFVTAFSDVGKFGKFYTFLYLFIFDWVIAFSGLFWHFDYYPSDMFLFYLFLIMFYGNNINEIYATFILFP